MGEEFERGCYPLLRWNRVTIGQDVWKLCARLILVETLHYILILLLNSQHLPNFFLIHTQAIKLLQISSGIREQHPSPCWWWCSFSKSCVTLCDPMDCSPLGSSVHGILQARLLEWVAISFSRESSQPSDQSCISCIGRRILYHLSHQGNSPSCEFVTYFTPEGLGRNILSIVEIGKPRFCGVCWFIFWNTELYSLRFIHWNSVSNFPCLVCNMISFSFPSFSKKRGPDAIRYWVLFTDEYIERWWVQSNLAASASVQ